MLLLSVGLLVKPYGSALEPQLNMRRITWPRPIPNRKLTIYSQELELSSVTELFQSLDQSSGTPSLSPSGQPTTFTRSNVYWKHTFLTCSTDVTSSSPCCYFNCFHCFNCFICLTLYCINLDLFRSTQSFSYLLHRAHSVDEVMFYPALNFTVCLLATLRKKYRFISALAEACALPVHLF